MTKKNAEKSIATLSCFEEELLIAIARATPIQQISEQFQMETSAVLEMKSNVIQKLKASNVLEALAYYKKIKLIEFPESEIYFN